jgi:hypothetical protein
MLVACLLAILTIGAVSASEDVASEDTLTVDNEEDNSVKESRVMDEDTSLTSDNDGEVLSEPYDSATVYLDPTINSNRGSIGYVKDTQYIDGKVALLIDAVTYYSKSVSASEKTTQLNIYSDSVNLPASLQTGTHNVVLNYLKNGASNPKSANKLATFKYLPNIIAPDVSVGETAYFVVQHLSKSSGTVTVSERVNGVTSVLATTSFSGGMAKIPISRLSKGTHTLDFKMIINGVTYNMDEEINVKDNTPGFSAGISAAKITVGKSVTVTLKGPATSDTTGSIYVDGKKVKELPFTGNVMKDVISGLKVGKHQVKVLYSYHNKFFSKTFTVNVVKHTISLKLAKATVKKSAKKLVLKATLKIDKKAAKSKKVTFKFKGKKYVAKTNKKGVAKVTVKKAVLKKLKVGKKVKYQASYGKKTVKKTAKVKK